MSMAGIVQLRVMFKLRDAAVECLRERLIAFLVILISIRCYESHSLRKSQLGIYLAGAKHHIKPSSL